VSSTRDSLLIFPRGFRLPSRPWSLVLGPWPAGVYRASEGRDSCSAPLTTAARRSRWRPAQLSADPAIAVGLKLIADSHDGRLRAGAPARPRTRAHADCIGELLQLDLPQPHARSIRAAAVGGQLTRVGVALAPHPVEPAEDRGDGELSRVAVPPGSVPVPGFAWGLFQAQPPAAVRPMSELLPCCLRKLFDWPSSGGLAA
jgi:hypothetical protein